jgi:hypothetical protein
MRRQRINYLDSGFQLNLKPGRCQQTMKPAFAFGFRSICPPVSFLLRIAVHDLAAGRAGSLEVPVTVAAN